MTPAADPGAPDLDVPRETRDRLRVLGELVAKWSPRINLISPGSVRDMWARHIYDSAQLWPLAPEAASSWVDLGAGGGFPGLVIAVIAAEARPQLTVTLVESDARKCAFLNEAARVLEVTVFVERRRIETPPRRRYDVVSARALASLEDLLRLSAPYGKPDSVMLFPKGARAETELTEAADAWHCRIDRIASRTDPSAVILKLSECRRV